MKQLKTHVSAAKEWLGRAERSLEDDNEVRGNLNLMLAQAELRRAQETKRSSKKWYLLIHSMLITCSVGVVLVIGFGGLDMFVEKNDMKVPIRHIEVEQVSEVLVPIAAKEESKQKIDIKDDGGKPAVEVVNYEAAKAEQSPPINNVVTDGQVESVVRQDLNVTPVQMQQLLRAAGRSLRGEE